MAFLHYANKMLRALDSLVQSCLEPGITRTYPVIHPVSQRLSWLPCLFTAGLKLSPGAWIGLRGPGTGWALIGPSS